MAHLCRIAEGDEEQHGVEQLLESLTSRLKGGVYRTVALDEVKLFVERWVEAIHKEADVLFKAKAL